MPVDLFALFSEDRFKCLDFHDVSVLTDNQVQDVVRAMEAIHVGLLARIKHQHIVMPKNDLFRRDLRDWIDDKLSCVYVNDKKRAYLVETTAMFMEYFYQNASHEFKMCIGAITASVIVIDDSMEDPVIKEQIRLYAYRYLRNLPQPEGICTVYAEAMRDMDKVFGLRDPQLANMLVTTCINFAESTYLETKYIEEPPLQVKTTSNQHVDWCASQFPYWMRNMTGMPSLYGPAAFSISEELSVPLDCWVAGADELNVFVNLSNDIFSFVKEMKVRETTNYIQLLTRAKHQAGRPSLFKSPKGIWTCRDSLYEVCCRFANSIQALDELYVTFGEKVAQIPSDTENGSLTGKGASLGVSQEQMEKAKLTGRIWKEFRQGYVASSIELTRYGLDNLRAVCRASLEKPIMVVAVQRPPISGSL